MTSTSDHCYTQLVTRTEQAIREFMDRADKLPLSKMQRRQQESLAHGVLALWRCLVSEPSEWVSPDHGDRIEADYRRLKALIRRSPAAPRPTATGVPSDTRVGGTPLTRRTYGRHWHRIQRSVRRVLAPSFGVRLPGDDMDWHEMWEDVATSTFIHLHQLKDWFPEPVSDRANRYIDEHEPLRMCADLANTAKHAWLDPARGGARANARVEQGGPILTMPLGRQVPGLPQSPTVEIRVVIDPAGKPSWVSAVDLIKECFELWRQFVQERVAAGELEDVEFKSVWIKVDGKLRLRDTQ